MKNSILSSIKEGKIRKNAKAKISALLEAATCITLIEKKSNVDDSTTDFDSAIDKAAFWAWYEENYLDLVILASANNGVITEVKFKDCQWYFANRIILTFNEPEPEPEAVAVEVKEIAIDTIKIIYSESNLFNSGDVLTLAEYDALANTKALEVGFNAGYVKVEIEITQLNTTRLKIRHDISAANPTLTYTLTNRGYNVTSAIVNVKPTVTYSQVKDALEQGYISPLNHNQKLAEAVAVEVINSNIETNVIDMFTAKTLKKVDSPSHAIGFNSFSEIINYSQDSETNIRNMIH